MRLATDDLKLAGAPMGVDIPIHRTLSAGNEEERTAGSGTDLISEGYPFNSGNDSGDVNSLSPENSSLGRGSSGDGISFNPLRPSGGGGFNPVSTDNVSGGGESLSPISRDETAVDGGVLARSRDLSPDSEHVLYDNAVGGLAGGAEGGRGQGHKKQSEIERIEELNPAYAKYMMEKQRQAEELRLRSTYFE